MTLPRALLCSSLVLAFGCSSAPPEPSRAAVSITVTTNGSTSLCVPSASMLEVPGGLTTGAVDHELTCDLSQSSCEPTANVAVDGKDNTSVSCSVKAAGDGSFNVQLAVDQAGIFAFNAQGNLPGNGQKSTPNFHVGETNHVKATTAGDDTCTVTVTQIGPGSVLAKYDCPKFDTANLGSDPGCDAYGAFLFDRCDH